MNYYLKVNDQMGLKFPEKKFVAPGEKMMTKEI